MEIVSRKHFMLFLAAVLVVAFALMGFTLYRQNYKARKATDNLQKDLQKMEKQSSSDRVEDIDKDLNDTNLNNVDKELRDIGKELNQTY